jgi:uncharacterized protein
VKNTTTHRRFALALPFAMPVLMSVVFSLAGRLFGKRRGYFAGFMAYWSLCIAISTWILGPYRCAQLLFRQRRHPAWHVLLLIWPTVGAIATRFVPVVRQSSFGDILTSAVVGTANAVSEELLWRGVFIELWPLNPLLGLAWPAAGFGAFHLAPQLLRPSHDGCVVFALAATALGLSWGWVAFATGSLRDVAIAHALTDASGLGGARFFRPGTAQSGTNPSLTRCNPSSSRSIRNDAPEG